MIAASLRRSFTVTVSHIQRLSTATTLNTADPRSVLAPSLTRLSSTVLPKSPSAAHISSIAHQLQPATTRSAHFCQPTVSKWVYGLSERSSSGHWRILLFPCTITGGVGMTLRTRISVQRARILILACAARKATLEPALYSSSTPPCVCFIRLLASTQTHHTGCVHCIADHIRRGT